MIPFDLVAPLRLFGGGLRGLRVLPGLLLRLLRGHFRGLRIGFGLLGRELRLALLFRLFCPAIRLVALQLLLGLDRFSDLVLLARAFERIILLSGSLLCAGVCRRSGCLGVWCSDRMLAGQES